MSYKEIIDVSVIITVYNIESYIRECIDSILCQNDIRLECICVDDASTDGSYEILKEYEKKDQRVKVIRNSKNMGLSSSRNVGFRNAKGEYLYNIDGDDYLQKGALKYLYDCAKRNNLDLLGFSATSFFENRELEQFGTEDEYVRKQNYPDVLSGPELFARLIENNDRASSNMVLYFYRREYFEKNALYGIEGIRYVDDSMFAMYMAAQRAMCIPDRLYMRRYREDSAVTSPMKKCYLESMIVLFLEELQIWQKSNLDDELNRKIEKYFNMRQMEIRSMYYKFRNDPADTKFLNKNVMAKYFFKYFIEEIPLYNDYIDSKMLMELKNSENIILYGAGQIANEVAKALEYNDIEEFLVAVTKKNDSNSSFRGKKINNIKELEGLAESAMVVVAMDKKNYDSVMKTLDELKFKKIYWIIK